MTKDIHTPDICFSSVSKEFILGGFIDVIRGELGLPIHCAKVQALNNISFSVQPGELIGVLGRNGSGKSTLLRVAGEIYSPDQGVVTVRAELTALFEMGLFGNDHLTGRKFAHIYFDFKNVVDPEKREYLIDDVQDFAELYEYFDEPMRTYSSGMMARFLFGVITALPAKIVLLDEILSVGDEYFQGKSYRRLMRMISKGTSGIFVTHDWFRAMRLCSNIIVLNRGGIEFKGDSQQGIQKYLAPDINTTKRVYFMPFVGKRENVYYRPGEFFSITIDITSTIDEKFCLGFVLEIPKQGIIATINNDIYIDKEKGRYVITIIFPVFPIEFPECFLSLFLSKCRQSGELSTSEGFDQLSWTSGDSLKLKRAEPVMEQPAAILRKPFSWKQTK